MSYFDSEASDQHEHPWSQNWELHCLLICKLVPHCLISGQCNSQVRLHGCTGWSWATPSHMTTDACDRLQLKSPFLICYIYWECLWQPKNKRRGKLFTGIIQKNIIKAWCKSHYLTSTIHHNYWLITTKSVLIYVTDSLPALWGICHLRYVDHEDLHLRSLVLELHYSLIGQWDPILFPMQTV